MLPFSGPAGALALGAASGFASSAPIGPINLWVAQSALSPARARALPAFLVGVISADLLWAWAAMSGRGAAWLSNSGVAQALGLAGGALFMALGARLVARTRVSSSAARGADHFGRGPRGRRVDALANAAAGAGMVLTNPMLVVFWLTVARLMPAASHPAAPALFLVGVAAGDFAWFRMIWLLVARGSARAAEKNLARVRQAVGALLFAAGAFTFGRSFF